MTGILACNINVKADNIETNSAISEHVCHGKKLAGLQYPYSALNRSLQYHVTRKAELILACLFSAEAERRPAYSFCLSTWKRADNERKVLTLLFYTEMEMGQWVMGHGSMGHWLPMTHWPMMKQLRSSLQF